MDLMSPESQVFLVFFSFLNGFGMVWAQPHRLFKLLLVFSMFLLGEWSGQLQRELGEGFEKLWEALACFGMVLANREYT